MKKFLTSLALVAITGTAMAGSFTVQHQSINGIGSNDQVLYGLSVKENINKVFAGDMGITNTQTERTNALSTRLEVGVTASGLSVGPLTGYVRTAMGQKYSNSTDFTYYSIEPGVTTKLGSMTLKLGNRYRSATNATANNDQTHTWRVNASYPVSKNGSVGLGFDRMRGDSNQNATTVSYSHSF